MKKLLVSILVVIVAVAIAISVKLFSEDNLNLSDSTDEETTEELILQTTEVTEPEEAVKLYEDFPAIAINWDVQERMEYTGGEITTEVKITNGAFEIEKGFGISIDGVLQECYIECGEIKTEKSTMPCLEFEADEETIFKISFVPNIGKKGDVFEMSLIHSYLPNYKITETSEHKFFVGQLNILTVGNIMLNFKEDSALNEEIAKNFSGVEKKKMDNLLFRAHHSETLKGETWNETFECSRGLLYENFEKCVNVIDYDGEHDLVEFETKIEVKASEQTSLYANIYGKPGKKRISVYVNNELQNVFDGKSYLDLDVEKLGQTEVRFNLDTSELSGYNSIYMLIKELNDEKDPNEHMMYQSHVNVLKII